MTQQIKITQTSNADMNIGVVKKMTAVKWLEQQLKSTYDNEGKLPLAYTLDLVKQAKQIEKEQIIKAIEDWYTFDFESAEQYYNETYNNESNI